MEIERSQLFGEVSYVKCLWLDRLMVGARLDRQLSVDRVRVSDLCDRVSVSVSNDNQVRTLYIGG